ncbi:hypothetical protein AEM51_03645 [Bacteroidetes bacterium UKL13-3]|nr:hypothetical protein AEM51_03645 [Bacteroidetes bacterium UKL13-3]HCP94718.1 hypothetical protein [Bacteroidota bacterium]
MNTPSLSKKNSLPQLVPLLILFTLVYITKSFFIYNELYQHNNIPASDHTTYMKIAEYFVLTGNENTMTSKNILFDLHFNSPYRFNETWLSALFLKLTSFDTVVVFENIVWIINYSLVVITVYELLLKHLHTKLIIKIFSAFAFIFFTIYQTNDYSGLTYYYSLSGFPKLSINYVFITLLFYHYQNREYEVAYTSFLFLFIFSPISLFVPLILALLIATDKQGDYIKRLLKYMGCLLLIILYYAYEQKIMSGQLGEDTFSKPIDLLVYIHNFFHKDLLLSFLPYVLILLALAILLNKMGSTWAKDQTRPMNVFMSVSCVGAYLTYCILNFVIHDGFQFCTNFLNVYFNIAVFALAHLLIQEISNYRLRSIYIKLLIGFLSFGIYHNYEQEKMYTSRNSLSGHSKYFISEVSSILMNEIKQPIGVYLPIDSIGGRSEIYENKEHLWFLSTIGRNMDVVNLSANRWAIDDFKTVEKKHGYYVNIYRKNYSQMAINIFKKRCFPVNQNEELLYKNFLDTYKIEYALSRISYSKLPGVMRNRISKIVHDPISKLYFYKLKV